MKKATSQRYLNHLVMVESHARGISDEATKALVTGDWETLSKAAYHRGLADGFEMSRKKFDEMIAAERVS